MYVLILPFLEYIVTVVILNEEDSDKILQYKSLGLTTNRIKENLFSGNRMVVRTTSLLFLFF